MVPRKLSNLEYEHVLSGVSSAGLRQLLQATHSATNGTSTAYTVDGQDGRTRRVVCCHFGTAADDIHFNHNAAATATSFPLLPERYFTVDCKTDDTLNFYNTTGSPITIFLMEVE